MMKRQPAFGGRAGKLSPEIKLGFFVELKEAPNRWFFDIYIQGSKYNF